MTLEIGTRLGPYEILAPLGAGGMGEVYRARDSRLDREVAIKVLPEHMAQDPEALARFEREAKAVAALSHPNIMAIHDFGTEAGICYAVMELLEGETLRARLRRSPLAWQKAAETGAAVADGLAAAHSKDLVHRDLKPDNIFLTRDGQVKILDFGLARRAQVSGPSDETAALVTTKPGAMLGTAPYMSPEQARGEPVGIASDIFSLGCVLYEMIVGQRPFARRTAAQTVAAILMEDPVELSSTGKRVPAELDSLIARCLEKNPHERFQSARDLAFSLRSLASQRAVPVEAEQETAVNSLAVLPFVNAGGHPDTEYLSDGIPESLLNILSQVPKLRVVPRSKAFQYKGQEMDPKKVGRELRARTLLTGKVLQRGDTLNVQAELVDVATEAQLWGERYNRKTSDIFAVEEEIAKQISEKLRLKLTGEDQERLRKRYTKDTEAYHLYLRGRYHWSKRTGEGVKKSIEYFDQAVGKDPSYALAHVGLADGYGIMSFYGLCPAKEPLEKGRAAALRALEIDGDLAEALTASGFFKSCLEWEWADAEATFRRAIELKPDYWLAHDYYALLLSALGRHEEAIPEVRRGMELEPLSLVVSHHAAWAFIRARSHDTAIEECRRALEMDPNYPMAHFWLGVAYGCKSLYDEAIPALQTALRGLMGSSFAKGELARAFAASGRSEEAEKLLQELRHTSERRYAEPYSLATVYAALGRHDEAFQWLETAYQDRSSFLATWLKGDPRLECLESDPRLQDLLRRVRLTPESQ